MSTISRKRPRSSKRLCPQWLMVLTMVLLSIVPTVVIVSVLVGGGPAPLRRSERMVKLPVERGGPALRAALELAGETEFSALVERSGIVASGWDPSIDPSECRVFVRETLVSRMNPHSGWRGGVARAPKERPVLSGSVGPGSRRVPPAPYTCEAALEMGVPLLPVSCAHGSWLGLAVREWGEAEEEKRRNCVLNAPIRSSSTHAYPSTLRSVPHASAVMLLEPPKGESGPSVAVCTIPKAGSTSLRRMLLLAAGKWAEMGTCPDDPAEPPSGSPPSAKLKAQLSGPGRFCEDACDCDETKMYTYFWGASVKMDNADFTKAARDPSVLRAAFVRNPFTRFLSGMRDKGASQFAKLMQLDPPERQLLRECEADVECELRSAVSILAARQRRRRVAKQLPMGIAGEGEPPLSEHWRPQAELCGAVATPFDFIGRVEHLGESFASLAKAIPWLSKRGFDDPTVADAVARKHQTQQAHQSTEADDWTVAHQAARTAKEYNDVRWLARALGTQGLADFLEVYAIDFALFGYDPDPEHYG